MTGYPGFEGTVGRTFAGSTPAWPERPEPPVGAPDVVIILVDDLGFADLGCYGAEIETPHLDALAARGLRWGSFHTAPMCSPTRAALLTGLHPHAAGFGLVANVDPGFPGYTMELAPDVQTLPEATPRQRWGSGTCRRRLTTTRAVIATRGHCNEASIGSTASSRASPASITRIAW
jgi:hypothetical protein